jgi:hypothetical protein
MSKFSGSQWHDWMQYQATVVCRVCENLHRAEAKLAEGHTPAIIDFQNDTALTVAGGGHGGWAPPEGL